MERRKSHSFWRDLQWKMIYIYIYILFILFLFKFFKYLESDEITEKINTGMGFYFNSKIRNDFYSWIKDEGFEIYLENEYFKLFINFGFKSTN